MGTTLSICNFTGLRLGGACYHDMVVTKQVRLVAKLSLVGSAKGPSSSQNGWAEHCHSFVRMQLHLLCAQCDMAHV